MYNAVTNFQRTAASVPAPPVGGNSAAVPERPIAPQSKASQIKSLMEDSGYSRSEARAIVDAGGLE